MVCYAVSSEGVDDCTHSPKQYYDETCCQLLCADCVSTDYHEGHAVDRVDKVAGKTRHTIQLSLPHLESCFPSINKAIHNSALVRSILQLHCAYFGKKIRQRQ